MSMSIALEWLDYLRLPIELTPYAIFSLFENHLFESFKVGGLCFHLKNILLSIVMSNTA